MGVVVGCVLLRCRQAMGPPHCSRPVGRVIERWQGCCWTGALP